MYETRKHAAVPALQVLRSFLVSLALQTSAQCPRTLRRQGGYLGTVSDCLSEQCAEAASESVLMLSGADSLPKKKKDQ